MDLTPRHHLTDRDVEKRTAICSIDGPVKIRRAGTGWTCAVRANAQKRKWNAKNPDRDRRSNTEHRLRDRDPRGRRGVCFKCGPVAIVPNGRGFMCSVRAAELGRVNHQAEVRANCRDCFTLDREIVWLTAQGCPRCLEMSDLAAMFRNDALEKRDREKFEREWGKLRHHGLSLTGAGDPYAEPTMESAEPRWRVIGAR